jgi:hypothetical protein
MSTTFTRSLGSQPGYQMNPTNDASGGFVSNNTDQAFALAGRFTRGRIDKAFQVTSDTLARYLGPTASTTINRLNEAYVQAYETFSLGAQSGTIARLISATGYALSPMYAVLTTGTVAWSVATTAPTSYMLQVTHLECFNDGVTMELYAPEVTDNTGTAIATDVVRLRLLDVSTGVQLYSFTGSLDENAKDDYGNSYFLPSVIAAATDAVQVVVGATVSVPTTANCYGEDANGNAKAVSANLSYFTEGATTYISSDYQTALNQLRYTEYDWDYLLSGGTENQAFISQMIAMCFATNRKMRFDVPGRFTPTEVIAWMGTLNQDTTYAMAQWAPLIATDPVNGGKDYIGTSGIKVGYACARNAQMDDNGLAPKNYPIAGSSYPITRTGVVQQYTPTDSELSKLADAKVNPVILKKYSAGSSYVFTDSLTLAKTTGLTKLESVVDMSTFIDDQLAAYGNEVIQLPLNVAIPKMVKFAGNLLTAAETAGWTNITNELGGRSFIFTCTRNTDRIDAFTNTYSVAYDGTTRAIFSTQNIVRTT